MSSGVMVTADFAPRRTPPVVRLPAATNTRLVPKPWNCSWIITPVDWLIETSKMTAATPMTMPSTVRPARILFFAKARKATRTISKRFMGASGHRSFTCRTSFPTRPEDMDELENSSYV